MKKFPRCLVNDFEFSDPCLLSRSIFRYFFAKVSECVQTCLFMRTGIQEVRAQFDLGKL